MIDVLQETTDWDTPNHIYYVNKKTGKLVAYIKEGQDKVEELQAPLSFSKSHRRFKKLGTVDGL